MRKEHFEKNDEQNDNNNKKIIMENGANDNFVFPDCTVWTNSPEKLTVWWCMGAMVQWGQNVKRPSLRF